MRGVSRLLLERLAHDCLDPIVANAAGSTAAWVIAKAVQTIFGKAYSLCTNRLPRHLKRSLNVAIVRAVRGLQHNLRAPRVVASARSPFNGLPLHIAQFDCDCFPVGFTPRHRAHRHKSYCRRATLYLSLGSACGFYQPAAQLPRRRPPSYQCRPVSALRPTGDYRKRFIAGDSSNDHNSRGRTALTVPSATSSRKRSSAIA